MAPRRAKAPAPRARATTTTSNSTSGPSNTTGDDSSSDAESDLSDYDSVTAPAASNNAKGASTKRKAKKQVVKPQGKKKQLIYRKKYGQAPETPSLSPNADDPYSDLEAPNNPWSGGTPGREQPPKIVTIRVNSNAGAMGTINLNLGDIITSAGLTLAMNPVALGTQALTLEDATTMAPTDLTLSKRIVKSSGFLKLPGELRDDIYRLLMVRNATVSFRGRPDLHRSAAFLRTCKTIRDEGTNILYGENSFHFSRTLTTRGKYWEPVWKEIGYQDVRRFLETIGPVNIAKMKHISFVMTDGSERASSGVEHPKFVNDPHLHHILRLIGNNTTLKQFGVMFSGRAMVSNCDFHFLNALTEIKCQRLDLVYRAYLLGRMRIDKGIEKKLRELMVIKNEDEDAISHDNQNFKVPMAYTNAEIGTSGTAW